MQDNQRIIEDFHRAAAKLTVNFAVQGDLVQEMTAHLIRLRTQAPGRPGEWYLQACSFHGRIWLRQQRRRQGQERLPTMPGNRATRPGPVSLNGQEESWAIIDEIMACGLQERLGEQLTPRQREALSRVLAGHTLREIGRELGISHVAVIKLRNKVARTGQALLRSAATPIAVASAPGYGNS